jgi:HEAT repeat protein
VSRIIFLIIALLFQSEAERTVERMRGLSMVLQATGMPGKEELARQEILTKLHELGRDSISPLVHALKDSDVQMRQNAALTMGWLAGGYDAKLRPPLDITGAIPDLIEALEDRDADVRAWAAGAIAETGPNGKEAIGALIKLLKDPEEGPRNQSCIALGRIGPAAREALPALREALNDPKQDVRRFAQMAIDRIQNK